MTPEQQSYLPAIAEHAKELIYFNATPINATGCLFWRPNNHFIVLLGTEVRETELLQLMQWIEERERLNWCNEEQGHNYFITLTSIVGLEELTASAHWHERWLAICKVKNWKPTL